MKHLKAELFVLINELTVRCALVSSVELPGRIDFLRGDGGSLTNMWDWTEACFPAAFGC